jgi:hypothetical protein
MRRRRRTAEAAPSAAIAVTTVAAGRIEQQAALEGCDFNASPTLSAAQMRD